ncbi:Gfo/Idh/MocA family oxidoreductase [Balneolaceae bacterium ANBcel3]|nr:Gfo/Idh/MocA family oxidoreductase [Balneolaceae bacterium ANBcel3]
MNAITRRDFVKASTITAGGLLLSSLPFAGKAYAAGSDRIKVALVGCGSRGTGAAFNALEADAGVTLVAMADVFSDRLNDSYERLSMRYGGTEKLQVPEENRFVGFDSYKHAIALADVVLLATPTFFRPLHYQEAVQQGKHIFMEKPVACDPSGVRSVLESGKIAKEKGLNVVVGLQRRYENKYREMHRRIQQGDLGDIISAQVYWNQGLFDVRPRRPEYSELEYQIRNWYYFIWMAGDQVLDQLIHNLDIANWFLGAYPISAHGMGGSEVRTGKEYGENFDHHAIEYTYPGGIIVNGQCRQIPNCANRVAEQFQGSKGFMGDDRIVDRNGNVIFSYDAENDPSPYQQEMDELFASVRAGNVIDDTDHGARSSMTAIMGFMASYSGQVVTWDQAIASKQRLTVDPRDFSWDTPPPVTPDENGYYAKPVPGQTRLFMDG